MGAGETERADLARLGFDGARRDRADQLGVVAVVLVGVGAGEPAHCRGELLALADVGVDGDGVTGPGVGAGERLAARGGDSASRGAIRSVVGMIFMSRNWRT